MRVPLQSGATAWKARVAFAAHFVPGVLITGYLVWITTRVLQGVTSGPGSSTPGWLALLLLLLVGGVELILIFSSFSLLPIARDAAPSDLLVTAKGFRIAGGVHDGLEAAWRDVLELKLIRREAPLVEGGWHVLRVMFGAKLPEPEIVELRVVPVEVGGTTVAIALDEGEQRALASVAALMADAMRDARGGVLPPGTVSPNIEPPPRKDPALGPVALACQACGAAVAPEPEDEVTCAKCQARVQVPESIRAKVTAAYALPALRATGQAALRRMMDAPVAKWVGLVIFGVGWGLLGLWLLAFAGVWVAARGSLLAADVIVLGTVMLATVAAIFLIGAIVRPLVIARHAHPVTVIDYAARPPAYEGGPLRCRTCESALPSRFDGRLARCVHCASDNVLVLDLSRELPILRRQASALDADLASWRRARVRSRVTAAVAAVALAGLSTVAVWRVRYDPLLAESEARCRAGDAHACTLVAMSLRNKDYPDRAAAVLERACDPQSSDAGVVSACEDLAIMLSDTLFKNNPRWPPRDYARAEALFSSACKRGRKLACESRKSLCESQDAPPACNSR